MFCFVFFYLPFCSYLYREFCCLCFCYFSFQRFYGLCKFILFWWKLDFFLSSVGWQHCHGVFWQTIQPQINFITNEEFFSLLDDFFSKNHELNLCWKIACQDLETLWCYEELEKLELKWIFQNHIYCLGKSINRRKIIHRKINWPSLISLAIPRTSFLFCFAVMYYGEKKMYPGGSRVWIDENSLTSIFYNETIFPVLLFFFRLLSMFRGMIPFVVKMIFQTDLIDFSNNFLPFINVVERIKKNPYKNNNFNI